MSPSRIWSQFYKRISEDRNTFTFFFLSIFFLFGLVGILNHAMWRDEMTIWLIVRDSESMAEFLRVIRYEPHPALWYFCVALLYRIARDPIIMQLFHLILGTIAAYLFLRYSPFRTFQKVLFVFGYLPFYEYLVISRNYSLGMLFSFLFCALYATRQQTYLWLAICLFFMANCNAYSLFIAIALGLTLIVEVIFSRTLDYQTRANLKNKLFSLAIFGIGVLTSIAFLIPPSDNLENGGLSRGWNLSFDIRHFFTALSRLWNSYIVLIIAGDSKYYSVLICGTLSLAIIALVAGIFWRKPLVLFFYAIATAEILLFTYIKFLGAQRHFGHLYLVLIISFWLASYYKKRELSPQIPKNRNTRNTAIAQWLTFSQRQGKTFLNILLCCQLIGGIVAFSRDFTIPYSASKAAAQYLQTNQLDRGFLVGSQDVAMSPLCGYLNRKIYYPERQALGSFVLFNRSRTEVDSGEVLRQVSEKLQTATEEVILILNYELKETRGDLSILPLEKFVDSLIYNEKYYLYRVRRE
ncbi:hypothetical protein [Oscillatoria sp. FACHB-1406]|uniref:hypothetical protein n=1 Tax=Oscillatoria sp. FACHB-1406 TaxID=2692846 RepID=UPI0016821F31|nr:hypothetical protein [Oscillatoria sp. FACHB-1406]MBD2579168.1 hypothetical protein [Oscillatoria sp. FACHB-1406]